MPGRDDVTGIRIDLGDFGDQLAEAEDALSAFSAGPARAAAVEIERAFSGAALTIERELRRVARSGELDLGGLASALVSGLASRAGSALVGGLAGGRLGSGGVSGVSGVSSVGSGYQPSNVTVNFAAGSESRAALGSVNQIAAAVARAALRGGRFL